MRITSPHKEHAKEWNYLSNHNNGLHSMHCLELQRIFNLDSILKVLRSNIELGLTYSKFTNYFGKLNNTQYF